jgi:hypothetical protein
MATLRRPATRAKHNEVSIILILLLRPKTGAKGGRGGGWLRCGVRVLELCSARTLQIKPTAGLPRGGLVVWTTLYTVQRFDSDSDGDL